MLVDVAISGGMGGGSTEGVDAAMRPEVEGKQPLLAAIAAATEEAWEGG